MSGKGRGDEGNGVAILNFNLVEGPVVDAGEGRSRRPQVRTNQTGSQALPDVLFNGVMHGSGEGILATPRRAGAMEQVFGMVIGAM